MRKVEMKVWAFDSEDDSKGYPYLFNFYDVENDQHHTFTDQTEAMDFACGLRYCQIWITNLEYDVQNLFRDHLGMLRHCFGGTRLVYSELPDDPIKFLNTLNHWPLSVKKMGEWIGLPKLEMKHDGSRNVTQKKIDYCRRDTEIVGRFVQAMKTKYEDIGAVLKTTVASTALDYFERHYHGKMTHRFETEQIRFFHTGYYGGRTEIFYTRPLTGQIYYQDINSNYAAAQKFGVFPALDQFYDSNQKKFKPDFELEGMAEITVRAPADLKLPYLPTRPDGKLIFAVGEFRGTYTYFEVREAVKLGYRVLKVHRAIEFPQTCQPFNHFIDDLYKHRLASIKQGDLLQAETFKSLLTHGYGKNGQKNESINLQPRKGMRACNCRLKKNEFCLQPSHIKGGDEFFGNDLVFRREVGKYPRHANGIWACYVTAYGRHMLYQALTQVEQAGGLLLYCATDAVVYEHKNAVFKESNEIGHFKTMGPLDENKKRVSEFWSYAHFKLPGLYCLKFKEESSYYRAKGVPKSKAETFFEKGKVNFKRPNRIRETVRRNLNPNRIEKVIPNYWEEREKEVLGKYTKRKVNRDGTTAPLFLGGKLKVRSKKEESQWQEKQSKSQRPRESRLTR